MPEAAAAAGQAAAPLGMPLWLWNLILAGIKAFIAINFAAVNAALLIWLERKLAARFQRRLGPETVGGPAGVLQSIADGVKLFAKEDLMPKAADRWVWSLAPCVVFFPAVMVYLVVPIHPGLGAMRDLSTALVYLAAVTSFTVLGIFMAGWGSNNKYSLLGAGRAIAMIISYEVPLVLSVLGVALAAGSLSLVDIVEAQKTVWFVVPQFLGFVVFYIASLAELNRTPFDLVTGESELVLGYATEYSGIRWSMFFFAEYAGLVAGSMVAATLFLGGYQGPFGFLPGWWWLFLKTYLLVFVAMWVRWTLPRFRIDQVLDLGWKFLLPVSLLNIVLTAGWMLAK